MTSDRITLSDIVGCTVLVLAALAFVVLVDTTALDHAWRWM